MKISKFLFALYLCYFSSLSLAIGTKGVMELNRVRSLMGLSQVYWDDDLALASIIHSLNKMENRGASEVDAHHQALLLNYYTGLTHADRVGQTNFTPLIGQGSLCEVISTSATVTIQHPAKDGCCNS